MIDAGPPRRPSAWTLVTRFSQKRQVLREIHSESSESRRPHSVLHSLKIMAATPDIEFERGLPASLDAERTILGAVLLDNHA